MNKLLQILSNGQGNIVGHNKTKIRIIARGKEESFVYQVYNKNGLLYQGSDDQKVLDTYLKYESKK
jgi:hypothetical protein